MDNKRRLIVFAVVAAGLLGWAFWSLRQPTGIANLDSQGARVVAFGDSLIAGYGSTPGHDLVSELSARIGEPIVNMGHNGDTTAEALARLAPVLAEDPRLVIVLLGGNDFLHRVPADTTFENLGLIIDAIQDRGAAVLLLGVRGGLFTDVYERRFSVLARAKHAGFVPNVLDGLIGDKEYMYDQVHPNDAGYARIADRVTPVLREMLRR